MELSQNKNSMIGRFILHFSWILFLTCLLISLFSRFIIQAELQNSLISNEEKVNQVIWVHMEAIFALIPLSIGVSLILMKKLTKPLRKMADMAQATVNGDFNQAMDDQSTFEFKMVGMAYNRLLEKQNNMIVRFQTFTQEMVSASYHIQTSAEKVNESTSTQNTFAEKTAEGTRQSLQTLEAISKGVKVLLTASEASSSSILEMGASIGEISTQAGVLSSAVDTTSSSLIEMTSAIKEVSENMDHLSQTAHHAVDSVNQIDVSVKKVEETAKEAAQISERVSLDAHELGVRAIVKTIDGMKKIKETVEKSSSVIHRLGKSSEDIGNILTVISEVTKQTNLLALNAAILAAQAGEQGKGFAVVADEIKKLADRTSSSTNEISRLIKDVQTETKDAVLSIKAGYDSVEEGMRLSLAAGDAVGKILESSKNSADLARKIMEATAEQVSGIRRIKDSVEKITSMSKEIVRATQEQTKGGEQIMNASVKMRDISNKLKSSTEEQLQGSRLITQEAENVNARVLEIIRDIEQQKLGEEAIGSAIIEIQKLVKCDFQLSREMADTVKQLIKQADLFNVEIRKVKVA
ncbi:MAG: methyl-accepting chemotaxis protein [Nitrospiria bacterium]